MDWGRVAKASLLEKIEELQRTFEELKRAWEQYAVGEVHVVDSLGRPLRIADIEVVLSKDVPDDEVWLVDSRGRRYRIINLEKG